MADSFSNTLSSGIQDISAVLSLFGTEQCELHVGSALRGSGRGGFLYAAVTPVSIFGSLGVAKAAFSIMLGTIPRFGAKRLRHVGFNPAGDAVHMIMLEGDRYVTEVRFLELLGKHFIRDVQQLRVDFSPKTQGRFYGSWNLWLMVSSFLVALVGVTPYLRFLISHHTSYLSLAIFFPICRVLGGLLSVFAGQLLLQHRIALIIRQRILFQLINDPLKQWSNETLRLHTQAISNWDESVASECCLSSLNKFLHTEDIGEHQDFIEHMVRSLEDFERVTNSDDKPPINLAATVRPSGEHNIVIPETKSDGPLGRPLWSLGRLRRRGAGSRSLASAIGIKQTAKAKNGIVNPCVSARSLEEQNIGDFEENKEVGESPRPLFWSRGFGWLRWASKQNPERDSLARAKKSLKPFVTVSWSYLCMEVVLLLGFAMVIVGYIGCFSIVQDPRSTSADVYLWLGLEFALSVLRVVVWAWNPAFDDPTGISFHLKPTTKLSVEEERTSVLPMETTNDVRRGGEFRGGGGFQTSRMSRPWIRIRNETDFWPSFTAAFGLVDTSEILKIDGFECWYAWVQPHRPNPQRRNQTQPNDPNANKKLYIVLKGQHNVMCTLRDALTKDKVIAKLTLHLANIPITNTPTDAVYLPETELHSNHELMSRQSAFRQNVLSHYYSIMAAMYSSNQNRIRASWLLTDSLVERSGLQSHSEPAERFDQLWEDIELCLNAILTGKDLTRDKFVKTLECIIKIVKIGSSDNFHDQLSRRMKRHTQTISEKVTFKADADYAAILTLQQNYNEEWDIFSNTIPRLEQLFAPIDRKWATIPREGDANIQTVKNLALKFWIQNVLDKVGTEISRIGQDGKQIPEDVLVEKEAMKTELDTIRAFLGSRAPSSNDLRRMYLQETLPAHDRGKIIEWFSPNNFSVRHSDISRVRVAGTGKWLLADARFKEWENGLGKVLCCCGIRGSGKTALSSMVVDHLAATATRNIGVACMYLQSEDYMQKPSALLAGLWRQLVSRKRISPLTKDLYQRRRISPTESDVFEVFNQLVAEFSQVYIIVDALDEYPEVARGTLLEILAHLGPTVNLMLTSRPDINLGELLSSKFEVMEIRASKEDLWRYVDQRIHDHSRLSWHTQSSPELREQIIQAVINRADGMFLFAKILVEILFTYSTIEAIQKALAEFPRSLVDAYDQVMQRISFQNEEHRMLAHSAVGWVLHAKRPLTVMEFQVALAIESGAKPLDEDNLLDVDIVLSVCARLLVINQQHNTVSLVHDTAQEYLDRSGSVLLPNSQTDITRALLTYLKIDQLQIALDRGAARAEEYEDLARRYPLLEYCRSYILEHAVGQPEIELQETIINFLEKGGKWKAFWGYQRPAVPPWDCRDWPFAPSPLWLAAASNLQHIAKHLLDRGMSLSIPDVSAPLRGCIIWTCRDDVNVLGGQYRSALGAASSQGHAEVVRLLLENSADVNGSGEEVTSRVVRLFIKHGADVNASYGSAITGASSQGHIEVVRLLLEHGADANASIGRYGPPALEIASSRSHTEIVELLLEHGAEIP
ncbi:Ankyrin repeat protein [Mycena venus]|uniref:Ankyrin repeat protein n=1 Tax=Mycena venus TaxID=2733690 RepID=A0A8H7CHI2_9AGAR|nr:Ankyrin repeat protein [Mycena venus]